MDIEEGVEISTSFAGPFCWIVFFFATARFVGFRGGIVAKEAFDPFASDHDGRHCFICIVVVQGQHILYRFCVHVGEKRANMINLRWHRETWLRSSELQWLFHDKYNRAEEVTGEVRRRNMPCYSTNKYLVVLLRNIYLSFKEEDGRAISCLALSSPLVRHHVSHPHSSRKDLYYKTKVCPHQFLAPAVRF